MEDTILKVEDLCVRYFCDAGEVYAVNGVTFYLSQGETLGIVGETGAGKTTTALSVLKLLPEGVGQIISGKMFYENINLIKAPEHVMNHIRGKEISMIFQDPMTSLNPVMRIEEQIAENIKIHNPKIKKDELSKKVDRILIQVGIGPSRKKEYPHQFSGGMKQRVIIAMSLACDPKILIADEPTTALDVTIQAQILELMNKLKRELNMGMILISHDLGVIVRMSDKVAVMYGGQFVEIGTVNDIFEEGKPHHPYTRGLFQSIPNLDDDVERLAQIKGNLPNAMDLPAGCKFAERCEFVCENCMKEQDFKTQITQSHYILCNVKKAIYYDGRKSF